LSEASTPSAQRPGEGPSQWVALLGALLPGLYLLITSTRHLISGIWPYDAKRIIEFVLLLLLFCLPAVNRIIRIEFGIIFDRIPNWAVFTSVFAFGWGIISAIVNAQSSIHLANSISDVALMIELVLAVIVLAACRRVVGVRFDQVAVAMLTATGLVVGIQEILGVLAAHATGLEFSYDTALQYFSKPRFYNQFQSWTVPVIVTLPLLFSRTPITKGVCVIALGLQWFILLMTAGRGSIVGLAVAFIIAFAIFPSVRRLLLFYQLWGVLLGTFLYGLVLLSYAPDARSMFGTAESHAIHPTTALANEATAIQPTDGEDTSSPFFEQSLGRQMLNTSGRTWMWSVALQDAKNNPWFGIGPMNYACTREFWFGHPHNFPIQLAAEWGFAAAGALIALALSVIWSAIQSARSIRESAKGSPQISALLLTGILAASVHACFSGVLIMPASQVTGILVCGTLFGTLSSFQSSPRVCLNQTRLKIQSWFFVIGLLIAVYLCALGISELKSMEERAEKLSARIFAPRMWQDSKICQFYVQDENPKPSRVNH